MAGHVCFEVDLVNRYFANSPHQPRVRRAGDAWLAVLGLVLVAWTAVSVDRVLAFEAALVDLSQSLPLWLEEVYRVAYFSGLLVTLGLFVAVIAQGKQRLDLLRDMLLAIAASAVTALLFTWWLSDSAPTVLPEFAGDVVGTFPIFRVAVYTSVAIVAAPHLVRPVRRLVYLMVLLIALAGFGLGLGMPTDAIGGIGVGLVAGALILLILGSPEGYPDRAAVVAGLGDLGVRIAVLDLESDQSWGVRRLVGVLDDGTPIEVSAYGRDATGSQIAREAWRSLWYRDTGRTFTYSRVQAVEHQALAILTAERHGVATPEVLAVGVGGDDMALLATTRGGNPCSDEVLDFETLTAMWREIGLLHRSRIAHGSLTLEAFSMDNGNPVIGDFAHASLSATDEAMSLDVVSFLYATAVAVGPEVAVGTARAGIGSDKLVAALPFLQVPALSRSQRRQVDKAEHLIVNLRDAVAVATDTELPEPAKLRRVRPKDLITPALSLIAANALLSMLTDIDFVAVWDVMQNAVWVWVAIGFLIGQTAFFFDATGMLFATGYPLPLKPLIILQVSVKWIGLAIPSAAGRVTMNSLFLKKYGVAPTLAATQGALDGLAGFVTEAGILLVALIATDVALDLDAPDINWPALLIVVTVLIVGTVIAILRIRRLRDLVVPVLSDAWNMLWSLLKDPTRTLGLLGSNLASRTILAITLWFILQAIGAPLPLVTALVVTVATNLLAGLVPIPGGIGVAEAVLTSMLMLAGLGADEAFAAAVVFRIATFYIPAGEGFFAMRWLEANDHL